MGDQPFAEDMKFYRRLQWVQRIGRWLMFSAVIAALAGLFGGGLLSHGIAGEPGVFWVEYERYARHHGPTEIVLHIDRDVTDSVDVRLQQALLENLEIIDIVPRPRTQSSSAGGVIYHFGAERMPMTIRVRVKHAGYAATPVQFELGSGEAVKFSTFVYP